MLNGVANAMVNNRGGRTLLGSEETDKDGIHLHIWNDMNNKNNYYPNLMRHIAKESLNDDSTSLHSTASSSEAKHLHVNIHELIPTLQSQISTRNSIKHLLVQTLGLDEFQNSDHSLMESVNELNPNHIKPTAINWNYHPMGISSIPKMNDRNLMNAISPNQSKSTIRKSRHDQIRTTPNFVHDYHSNLYTNKPKSVLDMVGYEIGGLPKYSGRLLANEPMPQEYRTFKMFEPVPRQIMLPPPTGRIPMFKPVPPRLKIVPIIDEYLTKANSIDYTPKTLPWKLLTEPIEKMKPNVLLPAPINSVQIIPFKLSEAITLPSTQKFISNNEYNRIESNTPTYHKSLLMPDTEAIKNHQVTSASKHINNLHVQQSYMPNNMINTQYKHSNDIKSLVNVNNQQQQQQQQHLHIGEHANKMKLKNNISVMSKKPVSQDNTRSIFNTMGLSSQNKSDIVDVMNKNPHKKTKTITKKPSHEKTFNDVIKLNVTGFHNGNDDYIRNSKSSSLKNDLIKKESHEQIMIDDESFGLRLKTHKQHPIDSVSADSIQLSQTYSQQTTNVPTNQQSKSTINKSNTVIEQLANDVKNVLLTSQGHVSQLTEFDDSDGGEGGTTTTQDPFLIAVYDQHDRAMHGDFNDDLDIAESETRRKHINTTIQRIDHGWNDDGQYNFKSSINKQNETNQNQYDTNSKIQSINHNINNNSIGTTTPNINGIQFESTVSTNLSLFDEKYSKWFNKYAKEKKEHGRTVFSEHFRKVEIEPNISWIVLPR